MGLDEMEERRGQMVGAEGNPVFLNGCIPSKKKKFTILTGPSIKSDYVCVFHVTMSGVKVQLRLCRVMFGIPHNCV